MKCTALLLSLLTFAGAGDDAVERGAAAFHAGRGEEALAEFQRAVHELGDSAPTELHYDVALAALQCGQPAVAEAAAEQAVARGGGSFVARRAFVRGSAAFHEAELAAAEAALPDADPTAFDRAIRGVESARDAWRSAATSRDDWPQARRNVERASKRLLELARAKAERQRKHEAGAGRSVVLEPPREPERAPEASNAPAPAVAPEVDLTPSQIERLLEVLARDEEAKRELRRARRAARPPPSPSAPSERDW